MQDVMKELERIERLTEGFRAKRAPKLNKKTLVMNPGVPVTFEHEEAGRNTCGERVRFCVSNYANVAGYFLMWREVQKMSGTSEAQDQWEVGAPRRHQFTASQNRTRLKARAKAKAEKFRALIKDIDERKKAGTMTYPRKRKK